jgi:mono/diheme cytochrome c family protein
MCTPNRQAGGSKLPQHKAQARFRAPKAGLFNAGSSAPGAWTFRRHRSARAVHRAEGPAVSSPAREGGGLHDPESEVRRTGTPTVSRLRRSFLNLNSFPGLTAGPTHCRPLGPGPSALVNGTQKECPYRPNPTHARAYLWVFAAFASLVLSGCSRQDMHDQPKYKPLRGTTFFEDSLSARPSVPGTVARGYLKDDSHLYTGRVSQTSAAGAALPVVRPPGIDAKSPVAARGPIFVDTFPFPITREVLERGRERFDIFCSVCHGRLGTGEGMVVRRGFRQPPSYHIDRLKEARVGHFFDVITNGFGAMPDYAAQIHARDRWAIVAYIRALQLSQNVPLGDLPAEGRSKLGIARERR